MGGRTRAPYPLEYKAELVRLVREEGRSPCLSSLRGDGDHRAQPTA